MKAKVDYWSMSFENKLFLWTAGKEYDVHFTENSVYVESDSGIGYIPWECCNRDLFHDVFGVDLDIEKQKFEQEEM